MASYTANQLYGAGTPIEALTAATTYTFTLSSPTSPGSAYFTVETVRNINGFYDAQSASNSLGTYASFIGIDKDTSITSPFISSIVVPQGGGSYTFTPTSNIAIGSSFLRSTGGVNLRIT
tara:strand:+ start:17 stop:376 length:360 start_codon:yes stop_codon:yes gene_type:complete